MSRTGIPITTTPIATLPLTLITITAPTTGQTIVYNGTIFVNNTVTGFATNTSTSVTSSTAFAVNNTTVAVPNTATIVLQTGKYAYYIYGGILTSAAVSAQLRLVQTAGTGTFTLTGSSASNYLAPALGGSSGSSASGTTIITSIATSTAIQPFYGMGEITVSTSSVTLQLSGFSASSTNITISTTTTMFLIKIT